MRVTHAKMTEDGPELLINFVTAVNPEDIVGLANNSYDDIIAFFAAVDHHIGDSVFTDMLREMVKGLDD